MFNRALALQKGRYEAGEKHPGYGGLCRELTAWRNDSATAWLADAPVHTQQQAFKDLESAYRHVFAKRARYPRFKKRGQHDSFRYPDPKQFKLDSARDRIFLPKLGWLRYRNSGEDVGIDIGVVRFATLSKPSRSHRSRLNKAILDQGWFEFRQQLEYKTLWNGGWLITVPPRNSAPGRSRNLRHSRRRGR